MIARVYTASKMKHASKWMELNNTCPFIHCHARWLKRAAMGEGDPEGSAFEFWQENEQDIITADYLLVYVESGDHLRGALVEAGIAIANRVRVIVVGDHPDYGTWKYHPNVEWADDMDEALMIISKKFHG